ncbi:MAG TPA: hypothetical protein VJ647_05425 [Chitinophagaceae bacterium]|nr:hypothetical protein [Chitinophagaceae bacterium]
MKELVASLIILTFIAGCGGRNTPDVSNIPVNISIERFDKAFFEKGDTVNMYSFITMLRNDFPEFAYDFGDHILGETLIPITDSSIRPDIAIKNFYRISKPIYDSIIPKFEKTDKLQSELVQAFKFVKYYFPAYTVPKIVTYVGPLDAPGIAIMQNSIGIGLQLFAGKDFFFYNTPEGQDLYPRYISRRFEPEYITPNCMKAVIEDIFPDNSPGRTLIEQMVEKGKRWYLLDHFLPGMPDSLKTDYTQQQMKWCSTNEGQIWNFILRNNDIYTTEPEIIKNYIGESPHTEGMPDGSPGNIGQWVGWQIVRTYTYKHPEITPEALMKIDARKLFDEAKYKPR